MEIKRRDYNLKERQTQKSWCHSCANQRALEGVFTRMILVQETFQFSLSYWQETKIMNHLIAFSSYTL